MTILVTEQPGFVSIVQQKDYDELLEQENAYFEVKCIGGKEESKWVVQNRKNISDWEMMMTDECHVYQCDKQKWTNNSKYMR